MKKIFILTVSFLAFQTSNAQETKTTIVVDSAQIKMTNGKLANDKEKEQLKTNIKNQKEIVKEQKRIDAIATEERKVLENAQDKLKNEQKLVRKENKKISNQNDDLMKSQKSEIKNNEKLIDANKELAKLQEKFGKEKDSGKLSQVETSEFEVKITKKQLEIRKIEEEISKAKLESSKL